MSKKIVNDYLKNWTSFEKTSRGVEFSCQTSQGKEVHFRLEVVSEDILRLRMNPGGIKEKKSFILTEEKWPPPKFSLEESEKALVVKTEHLHTEIKKDPWEVSIRDSEGRSVFREKNDDFNVLRKHEISPIGYEYDPTQDSYKVRETIAIGADEKFYGFGEKFSSLNKRGQVITSWTTDALGISTQRSYKNVPFFLSTNGYGLFIHSTYKIAYNMGASSFVSYSFEIEDADLDYFLIYGPSFKAILKRYSDLTGYAPMPPKWSFGFWMSKFGYRNRKEVEELTDKLRKRDIPCDVVHIDPYWMGDFSQWCDLKWDEERFPNPKEMMAELKKKGFKICLWENPYVPTTTQMFKEGKERGYFVKDSDGSPFLIKGWAGDNRLAVVDFTNPEATKWYQDKHRELLQMGVATFKTDFGEWAPEDGYYYNEMRGKEAHNLYPLLYNRAVFETIDEYTQGKALVWSRSTYAGSQKYPVHWGGDCRPTYKHMACQLRGGLSLGMSGIPFYGHDMGGFAGETNPRLYVRWSQFGFFSSHSRSHGVTPREPWEFGKSAEDIFRKYDKLRYRLLPYIYSSAKVSTMTGLPVMRPLILEYQNDPNTHNLDLEYLFGESFLVAPLFSEDDERSLYLPGGKWIDYWNKKEYEGPSWIDYYAPWDVLPLFVKKGAIIPMGPEMSYVGEIETDPLTLDIYPDESGEFTLYDEDQPSIDISYSSTPSGLQLTIGELGRNLEIILNNLTRPKDVKLDGNSLQMCGTDKDFEDAEKAWRYDGMRVMIKARVEKSAKLLVDLK